MPKFKRSVAELQQNAVKFWPKELLSRAATISPFPLLLNTQEDFLAILSVPVENLEKMFQVLEASSMPANLFLKHLMVLTDFSGETFKRIMGEFDELFPSRRFSYSRMLNNKQSITETYEFKEFPILKSTLPRNLGIENSVVGLPLPLTDSIADAIALLLFGSIVDDAYTADILEKCNVGELLGDTNSLQQYVKERYIWVSRITNGTNSNSLGQFAQAYTREFLQQNVRPIGLEFRTNSSIPGVSHTRAGNDSRESGFDIVISKENKHIGIEVSFQVTTNSTIERKSRQAQALYEQVEQLGHKIAYVIDGAGNMERVAAIRTITDYSHCTVTYHETELLVLCEFINDYFGDN